MQCLRSKTNTPRLANQQVDPNQYQVRWFDHLELLAASKHKDGTGSLVWRFPVLKEYLQGFVTYAGGAQAAAHDNCTGWALLTVAKPGYWATLGSSRTLNISYFKAAQEGDVLLLEAKVRFDLRAPVDFGLFKKN